MRDGAGPEVKQEDKAILPDSLLVVEIGQRVSVGACGSLLAQMGATVVVVEPPVLPATGKWRHRACMLAGKKSIVIDTACETGQELLKRLADSADILLLSTDFPAADTWFWNAPRRSDQIVCDITAFGHGGPMAGHGGSEEQVQAYGGIVGTTGKRDQPPVPVGTSVLEMSTAIFAASAIMAAQRVRRLHGVGQRIDIAIMDTAVNGLVNFLALHFAGGLATRSGNRHPLNTPWGSYRARDGYVLICAMTDEHFTKICKAIGREELISDARFISQQARQRNVDDIDRTIEAWTMTQTVADCEKIMAGIGIPSGPIINVADLANEKNLQHRKTIRRLRDPLSGIDVAVPLSPLRMRTEEGAAIPDRIPGRDEDRMEGLHLMARRAAAPAKRTEGDPALAAEAMEGLRVVEIGQYTVAPLASRHLGALGAEVIKIEAPGGDAIRGAPPFRDDGLSYIFALSNTDKQGLVLDLREERDRARLHRLLDQSDILVENLRQGALARFGFDQPALARRHPQLVCCSINGFGNESVYPGRPAFDTVIQAMSGLMSLTEVDGEPMKTGISASDMIGGQFGLLAAIAGIECRERTGKTLQFDISMQDASVWVTQMDWPGAQKNSTTTILAARDGYVLAEGNKAHLQDLLAGTGQQYDRRELTALLNEAGKPCAPVLSVKEALEHPHCVARGLLIERPTSDGDAWVVIDSPLRLHGTPSRVRTVMARLGADDAALIARLGLDGARDD